jgi:hypothetical protein
MSIPYPEGTICRVKSATPPSLTIYNQLKPLYPNLECICNLKGFFVVAQIFLKGDNIIVSCLDNPLKMSVAHCSDLAPQIR